MLAKIRTKKSKPKTKGFDPNLKTKTRSGWRYVAVELNSETWNNDAGFPDLHDSEILDVLEIHHLAIRPVVSHVDKLLIKQWSESIAGVYISPVEFLAEIYTTTINEYALSIGANVGRIYHNSHLGDPRIHCNSIGHIFEPSDGTIPSHVSAVLKKYVVVEHIADGKKITLKNRLGL